MTGCFKIYYSMVCQGTGGWDDIPADQDLVVNYKGFLLAIKQTLRQLQPWPRCFRPVGFTYRKLVLHHDGSQQMASYALYIISAPAGAALTPSSGYSLLVGANNGIRSHSVPRIETSSGLFGVEAAASFMYSHQSDSLASVTSFQLQIESHSTCHIWCLDPQKLHRSVLVKNLCRAIHLLIRDLTLCFLP